MQEINVMGLNRDLYSMNYNNCGSTVFPKIFAILNYPYCISFEKSRVALKESRDIDLT